MSAPSLKLVGHPLVFFFCIFLLGAGVWHRHRAQGSGEAYVLSGQTMGTTYRIIVRGGMSFSPTEVKERIDKRLREINLSMSTWIPESEISAINKMPAHQWISVSKEFYEVLAAAMHVSTLTDGLFDPTVEPLVSLWGYGPLETNEYPTENQIQDTLKRTGYKNIELGDQSFRKRNPNISLDFSAIAKGYGVDRIADLLESYGASNYLVEIGGEVTVKGLSHHDVPWAIGIETPKEGFARNGAIASTLSMTEGSVATSGSYHRYKRDRGKKSHHILNPRTGRPTSSNLVSVTVYAPSCITADAIATALMVMGAKRGLQWITTQSGVEALFLIDDDGKFRQLSSAGFAKLTGTSPPV